MTPRPGEGRHPDRGRTPRRRNRARTARGASRAGERFTAEVGPVAHGGHCVVRLPEPESRVVFVRHTIPGEQVVLEITEGYDGDRFWRADAVEVLRPAPDRVAPPCRYAGPGGCGGCDFQHVTLAGQRDLKTAVVREQLVRLGGLSAQDPLVAGLEVEAMPGDTDGLGWRTRVDYARTPDGRPGLRKHRSHEVIAVEECLIATADAQPGAEADAQEGRAGSRVRQVTVAGSTRSYAVAADGFWQVHPAAAQVLVSTVLDLLDPRPGDAVLDLYAGVGLFGGFLGERVGPAGSVTAVEADRTACEHAAANLADVGGVVERGGAEQVLDRLDCPPADLVVLDPPREGARRRVVEQVVSCAPRAVGYVACDPAALARDVAIFAEHGYRPTALRTFDAFPMTHHVECVALLVRP